MQAYGYTLRGLPPPLDSGGRQAGPRGTLDIRIVPGPVNDAPATWLVEDGDTLRVGWAGEADYLVRASSTPSVIATLGTLAALEGAFCCCLSVLPLALPLLGLEPLHGSAIATRGGALLLLGPSGVGKSTLADTLIAQGYDFLADDACAIDEDGRLWAGPPLLRLSGTAAAPGEVVGVYDGKAVIRAASSTTPPSRPAAVVILDPAPGRSLAISVAADRDAFVRVLAHVRSPAVFKDRRAAVKLARVARVAGRTPVATASYDPARHPPVQLSAALMAWVDDLTDQAAALS